MRARPALLPLVLLACCAALAAAAPAGAVGRGRANVLALQTLGAEGHWVYGLPARLRAGQRVSEDGPAAGADSSAADVQVTKLRVEPLRRPAWLFWEDLDHGAGFEHPSRLLLLDAATGAVVRDQQLSWRPLVDGRVPPFLRTEAGGVDRRYVVYAPPGALNDAVDALQAHPTDRPSILPAGFLRNDCLVTIGLRLLDGGSGVDPEFDGDLKDWERWALHARIRLFSLPAESDGKDLVARVRQLATMPSPCRNVVVFLAGHGRPAPDDPLARGASSSVIPMVRVGTQAVRSPGSTQYERSRYVLATDLERMLAQNPRTTFELVTSACFGGRFVDALVPFEEQKHLDNLVLIGSAANAHELSWTRSEHGIPLEPGVAGPSGVPNYPPRLEPPEGDWTHAVVEHLYAFSDDRRGFGGSQRSFLLGLRDALQAAQKLDFSAVPLGWEHPQAWVGPLQVTYRYDVAVSVRNGTTSFSATGDQTGDGAVQGSVTSSWEATWKDVPIEVDRTHWTVGILTNGPYYAAPQFTLAGHAKASWQGRGDVVVTTTPSVNQGVAYSCSYDQDVSGLHAGPGLTAAAGDPATRTPLPDDGRPPQFGDLNTFADTGLFLLNLGAMPAAPAASLRGDCTPPPGIAVGDLGAGVVGLTAGTMLAGADACSGGAITSADEGLWLPAWELGAATVAAAPRKAFTFTPTSPQCQAGIVYPTVGTVFFGLGTWTATFGGTYAVTLTRRG